MYQFIKPFLDNKMSIFEGYGALKAPYPSKIDILLSKKGLINWYMVLIQS